MTLEADLGRMFDHLCTDGGWWSVQSLHAYWFPRFSQEAVQQLLDVLCQRSLVVRRLHIDWATYVYAATEGERC